METPVISMITPSHPDINSQLFRKFAAEQIHYALGGGANGGTSFVVGYGERFPRRPHHAASSCPKGERYENKCFDKGMEV